jgi:hypothetical protein
MKLWSVRDSQGHEIYLTAERWEHIQDRHPELTGRLGDVLDAIRRGRREQDAILPNKYTYINRWEDLWPEYNCIIVKVLFRFTTADDGSIAENNFVVTAWPAYMQSLER